MQVTKPITRDDLRRFIYGLYGDPEPHEIVGEWARWMFVCTFGKAEAFTVAVYVCGYIGATAESGALSRCC